MTGTATSHGIVVIALACLLAASQAHGAPATDAMIAEVRAALDGGDTTNALRLADAGLGEADASAQQRGELLLDRGVAHELLGAHQDAMADFTAAIETHALPKPERAQALLQRGFLLDSLGQLNDAALDYTAVVTLKAGSVATALNNRANIYRRQNRLAEARRDYLAALAADSARPQFPYYGLGQIAEVQNDPQAARGFYAKAVAADPDYQLASERLVALGGVPEASLTDPGTVVLHPPQPAGPITLHPPPAEAPRPALKPPQRPQAPAGLGLRPALDATARGQEVQLGAWRSPAEAQAAWVLAQRKAAGALDGLLSDIVVADLPGRGRYYRLRTSAGMSGGPAHLCAALEARGLSCMPVRD